MRKRPPGGILHRLAGVDALQRQNIGIAVVLEDLARYIIARLWVGHGGRGRGLGKTSEAVIPICLHRLRQALAFDAILPLEDGAG